jgi:RHS repeat-associated protein
MRVSQRQNISGTWTTGYYGYDGFGTTRQLLDGAGVVTDTFAFDGFGNLVARTGTTPNQYLYRGEALDAGTGMYYLRARWYRPGLGRFVNLDTVESKPGHFPGIEIPVHLYSYTSGNPIKFFDPDGHVETAIAQGFSTQFIQAFLRGVVATMAACDAAKNDPFCRELNSGKIQAQGTVFGQGNEGTGQSWKWSQEIPPTAFQGVLGLNEIWAKLTGGQQKKLNRAFSAAIKWVIERPPIGYPKPGPPSFYADPNIRGRKAGPKDADRIDIEIWHGIAFKHP